jgi:hypothetical protein
MNVEFESMEAGALRRYARLVERALGLGMDGHCVQMEPMASIYLPLHDRLARFPDHDVALIWDEQHGWAVGVEDPVGADIAMVAYLTADLLPEPLAIARFVDQVLAGETPGAPEPHLFRSAGDVDDLVQRLAAYAQPLNPSLVTAPPPRRLDARQ